MEKNIKKIGKMNELAWVIGIVVCCLGVCFCTKANFGISMIAAPAYIIHLWLRDIFPWFTQGTSEYVFQGILFIIMCITIRKFKVRYLLSFGTAVIAGLTIDFWFLILGGNGAYEHMAVRIVAFILGEILSAVAIAFIFRTTLPVQIYELVVCEIAEKFNWDKNKVKLVNDIAFFAVSVILALVLTKGFNGVGIGTVIISFTNAPIITLAGKIIDKHFTFESRFPKLFK